MVADDDDDNRMYKFVHPRQLLFSATSTHHHPQPPPPPSSLQQWRPRVPKSLALFKPLIVPHSLQDLCAITIRGMVSHEQLVAYPNVENFKESSLNLTKSKTVLNLYHALPTILAKYLESFTKNQNSEARGMSYFCCCNMIEKTEMRDRKNLLLGQPPCTVTYNSRAIMRNPEYRFLRNLCLFSIDHWIEPIVQSVHFYEDLTDVTSFVYRGERIVLPHALPSGRRLGWIEPKVQSIYFYEDLTDVTSFVNRGERIVLPHALPSGRRLGLSLSSNDSSSREASPTATLDGYS